MCVGLEWLGNMEPREVYNSGSAISTSVVLNAGVDAFLIYAEPNPFQLFTITATTNDGGILSQVVDGFGGAAGFGFYGTGGTRITGLFRKASHGHY